MGYGVLKLFARFRSRTAAFTHDLLVIPAAWLGAYWLRFNLGVIPEPFLSHALMVLPFLFILQGAVFWHFGLYRGVWRFASVLDLREGDPVPPIPDGTSVRDWGQAAGLWPSQRNRLAWSRFPGDRFGDQPPFDNKTQWGMCSSKY